MAEAERNYLGLYFKKSFWKEATRPCGKQQGGEATEQEKKAAQGERAVCCVKQGNHVRPMTGHEAKGGTHRPDTTNATQRQRDAMENAPKCFQQ